MRDKMLPASVVGTSKVMLVYASLTLLHASSCNASILKWFPTWNRSFYASDLPAFSQNSTGNYLGISVPTFLQFLLFRYTPVYRWCHNNVPLTAGSKAEGRHESRRKSSLVMSTCVVGRQNGRNDKNCPRLEFCSIPSDAPHQHVLYNHF